MKNTLRSGLAALALAAAFAPAGAQTSSDDAWRFDATLYMWLPSLKGTTQFPSGAGGPTIDLRVGDVLDKLDRALMGSFEARHGQWGGLVDWVHSDLAARKSATRDLTIGGLPPVPSANLDLGLDVTTDLLTLAGTYTVLESPTNTTRVLAGARMIKMDQTLNWTVASGTIPGLSRSGTTSASNTNWDGIIGVRGRARIDNKSRWFWPYHFDIGTGQSNRTLQAAGGVAYAFDFGDVGIAWRYVDYRFKSSEPIQSLKFNGLALGVNFRF